MTKPWHVIPSPTGDGPLFVRSEVGELQAVIPPGHRLPLGEAGPAPAGWRIAVWMCIGETAPALDTDRPATFRSVDTVEVLRLLPAALHNAVEEILRVQLDQSEQMYQPPLGRPLVSNAAQAQGRAERWLRSEISSGFAQGPPLRPALPEVPDTADRLLACIPAPLAFAPSDPTWTLVARRKSISVRIAVHLLAVILKRPARDMELVQARVPGGTGDGEPRLAVLI